MLSPERLHEIFDIAKSLCVRAKANPLASIIVSTRDQLPRHWLTCATRLTKTTGKTPTFYICAGENGDQIIVFLPAEMNRLQDCRTTCRITGFALAAILSGHGYTSNGDEATDVDRGQFETGFATRAISERGFVASRARHTLIGLEYVCSEILSERSHWLRDMIPAFLDAFLGVQDQNTE